GDRVRVQRRYANLGEHGVDKEHRQQRHHNSKDRPKRPSSPNEQEQGSRDEEDEKIVSEQDDAQQQRSLQDLGRRLRIVETVEKHRSQQRRRNDGRIGIGKPGPI